MVISTGVERGELRPAAALAHALRSAGDEVQIFLMDDAVDWLRSAAAAIDALVDDGCDVVACATSADQRGIGPGDTEVLLGSQDDHAIFVYDADRVVAFT